MECLNGGDRFPVGPCLPVLLQDMADDLSSELSGNFRSVVLGLLMLAPVYDAYELRNAIKVHLIYLSFPMLQQRIFSLYSTALTVGKEEPSTL